MMTILEKNFYEIEKYLLYLMVLTIPIDNLPERYGLPVSIRNIHYIFLIIAILIATIYFTNHRTIYSEISKAVKVYLLIFILWPIFCTLIGVMNFPYWDNQSDIYLKSTNMVRKIALFYPDILNNVALLHLKYSISLILNIVSDFFVPLLGIPFVLFMMFRKKDKKEIMNVISRAATVLAITLSLYSIVEILWLLTGCEYCEIILKFINTLLYDPKSNDWWPPLLWNGQLRSFTYEPSFFGIIAMFILPLLWYRSFGLGEKRIIPLLILFTWMVFLTKSRTAQVIFLSELLLLLALSLCGKYKSWHQCVCRVLMTTILAFIIFISAPSMVNFMCNAENDGQNQSVGTMISRYIDEDVSSIGIEKKRSNISRWGNMVATFKVGMEHPVFGVGNGLQHEYIADNIPTFALNDGEINFWIERLKKNGFMKAGFPNLNSYTVVFACYGILGLVLYLIPAFFLTLRILKIRSYTLSDFGNVCLIVCLYGQFACLLCNHFMYTYPLSLATVICLLSKTETQIKKMSKISCINIGSFYSRLYN